MAVATQSPSSTHTPDDIVRDVKNLPSAPRVLPRLKSLLSDGNSVMSDIVALVRLDPGIAARVLQTSNSAYFSGGLRCDTVYEAVKRVGYDQIYDLVAYAVASQVLVRPLDAYGIEADELWKRSVACALATEALAERTAQDRDAAYTVGLLHCVGMVALDEWSLRGGRKLTFRSEGMPREAVASERAALGFTQAEVGGALLRDWQFTTDTSEAVRWQYTPRLAGVSQPMAGLLHVAKWIRSTVCAPAADQPPPLPDAIYLKPLGVDAAALSAMADSVRRRLEEVSSVLDTTPKAPERHRFPGQPARF
ncbi:HDOD domain-containing protein [Horticoccus sp. 23ND18S-11]|uniref:HDOD domain-containing protein n=1 Tax=Horticoccus sp. 23ND18S-11 TaxID=3391832 RepID=UPI0039C95F60